MLGLGLGVPAVAARRRGAGGGGGGGLAEGWDITTTSYDNVSFNIISQDTNSAGLWFSTDGTKMYMSGTSNRVYQYSLSSAWDITTAAYDGVSFSVSGQESTTQGVAFSTDGTKMYITGITSDDVHQYTLSTAWNVSTASYDSVALDVSPVEGNPRDITFSPDGLNFYHIGTSADRVHHYSLSTAWDLSTATFVTFFAAGGQESVANSVRFKDDGTKMYVLGSGSDRVHQYTLATPWDLTTASYDTAFVSVGGQDAVPQSMFFGANGTKMYMVGVVSDLVHQYTLTDGS